MHSGYVTTFYSYKGGCGRTFLLANVAWLLARWGRRVLCVDWDIEAPGLHRYLTTEPGEGGLIDVLEAIGASSDQMPEWKSKVRPVSGPWTGQGCLDLLGAGEAAGYHDRAQALDWDHLFSQNLQATMETLRAEWVACYDHILLDSRTGVTDIGGICAAQLPDLLVMLLTTSHQSLNGTLEIARRVRERRSEMPLDRGGFFVLPVPARMHPNEETQLEREWLQRFSVELADLFEPWKDLKLDVIQYLGAIRLQEVARWSYGEGMPVCEERTDDPRQLSWAIANIAALVDRRLDRSGEVVRGRFEYVSESAGDAGFASASESRWRMAEVFVAHARDDTDAVMSLYRAMTDCGLTVTGDFALVVGASWAQSLRAALTGCRLAVVLLSVDTVYSRWQARELSHLYTLWENGRLEILPILLDDRGLEGAPPWLARLPALGLKTVEDIPAIVTAVRTALSRQPRPHRSAASPPAPGSPRDP
jgi:MinD-like ATPase involved in chromosome partitioning or flagellar assembly